MTKPRDDQLAGAIGKAIAHKRQTKRLTQEQVAERLGIGNEAVSRIERGIVMPTVERLVALAQLFECEAAELLSEGSYRATDQSQHLDRLLAPLSQADRQIVIDVVKRLAEGLANRLPLEDSV